MQQRRVRLGDILDDYCPRERRITNHAVVAMIDETVKQTRCTTCDADHEYREAKVPAPRRKKAGALASADLNGARPRAVAARVEEPPPVEDVTDIAEVTEVTDVTEPADVVEQPEPVVAAAPPSEAEAHEPEAHEPEEPAEAAESDRDEWPVHRPLIRATLPRPEGQTPERKGPDFTFRAGGRFENQNNNNNNGQRHRHRPTRHAQGQPSGQARSGGGSRPGQGPRHGAGQGQQGQGNRQSPGGGRPAQGRGPRQRNTGRKRGR